MDNKTEVQKIVEQGQSMYKAIEPDGSTKYVRAETGINDPSKASDIAKDAAYQGTGKPSNIHKSLVTGEYKVPGFSFSNGKVKISAPTSYLESDWFKENFSENNAFKQLVAAYAKDPEGKTEVTLEDGTKSTLSDLLAKYQEGFKQNAEVQDAANLIRREVYSNTGVKLSTEDAKIYVSSAKKSEDKNSKSKVIYLPEIASTVLGDALKNLKSYNEETNTISAEDFYKWHNLDDENFQDKDQKLLQLDDLLTKYISRFVYDENSEDAAAGATEYARAVSFFTTLSNDKPDANLFTGAKLFTAQAVSSFVHNIAGFGAASLHVMEKIPVVDLVVKGAESMFYDVGASVAGVDSKYTNEFINRVWTTGAAVEAMSSLDFIDKNIADNLTKLSDWAVAGSIVGGIGAEIVKQLILTNPGGEAVGMVTENALAALAHSTVGQTFKTGLLATMKTYTADQLSAFVVSSTKFIGTSANIITQGICDSIIDDPELLDKALSGKDGDKVMEALALNTAMNAFGEMTGFGSSKLVQQLADTRFGLGVQKLVSNLAAKKFDLQASLAEKLSSKFNVNEKVVKGYKLSAQASRDAANSITEAASKEGATTADIVRAKDAAIANKIEVENAIKTSIKNSEASAYDMMMSVKEINTSFKNTMKAADTVYKAEKAAGMSFKKGQYISQETSNYIAAKQRVMNLSGSKSLTAKETEILNSARSIVGQYENATSKELLASVNKLEVELGKAYHAQIDFELKNHLLTKTMENKILKLRKDGRWGEDGINYIGTIAIKEGENVDEAVSRWLAGSRRSYELAETGFGQEVKSATEDYLDPVNTLLARQIGDAQKLSALNNKRLLASVDMRSTEIDITGKPLSRAEAKRAKKAYDNIGKQVKQHFLKEDVSAYDFSHAFRANRKAKTSIAKDPGRIDRAMGLKQDSDFANAAWGLDDTAVAELRAAGLDIPEYKAFATDAEFQDWYKALDADRKAIIEHSIGGPMFLNAKEFNAALTDTTMVSKLSRYDIAHNNDIVKSDLYRDYVRAAKFDTLTARRQALYGKYFTRYRDSIEHLEGVKLGVDDFTIQVNEFTKDLKSAFAAEYKDANGNITNSFISDIHKELGNRGVPVELVDDYFLMSALKDFADTKEFGALIDKNLKDIKVAGNVTNEERMAIVDSMRNAVKENINGEWAESAQKCAYNGVSDEIDMVEVSRYVTEQMKDFTDTLNQPNVMKVIGDDGEYHIVQLSPLMADFVNAQSNYVKSNFAGKLIRKTNNVFRLGTTGISLRSMVNQFVRDPINAWVMGGMNKTFKSSRNELAKYFGDMPIDRIARELGDEYDVLIKEMESAGVELSQKNIAEAVADRLGEEGKAAYSGLSVQERYYADTFESSSYGKDSLIGKTAKDIKRGGKTRSDMFMEKIQEVLPNNWRENLLRRTVYMNNLEKAMKKGHTLQEAKSIATYIADNATTDFSRTFAWGNSIVRNVPYLGAAINGTASFWRLLEIDPVGISCRFLGGLAMPTIALTAQSLQGENAEVWKNIPEYEKENSLVFVVDGKKFSMPVPQELSAFLKPFRQAVEKMHGANDHSWFELISNDLLSISPIDLTGLVDLDDNYLIGDGSIWERMNNEAATLISQLSPAVLKTAYMAYTGVDPFTGNKIDKSFTIIDDEGHIQTMDYTTDTFSVWLAGVLGDEVSPSSAYAILKSLFGSGITNIASGVMDVVQGNFENALDREANALTGAFSGEVYDLALSNFNQAVKALEQERNILMSPNGEIAKLNQQILFESDKNKLETMRAQVRQIEQDYADKVKNMVDKYVEDGGTYGATQLKKVISLLTFNATTNDLSKEDARQNALEVYYDSRQQSLNYLRNLGFKNTNDWSSLGYITTNEYGEIKSNMVPPSAIQGMEGEIYGSAATTLANIRVALEDANLDTKSDDFKEMMDKVDKAYDTKNYDLVNKLYKEWDKKVMDTIAPIIAQNDLTDVLNNNKVIDYLDDVIKVPSDAMGKGKYYSSKTGLNKQRGFAKSFIQKLYANMNK